MKTRRSSSDFVLKKLVRLHLDTLGCYLTVGEYLHYLYREDKLIDVAVHVQDKTFSAHRVALSCYSGYFAELFSFNTGKKIPFEMRLKGICPEAFAVFLEFVYTGRLQNGNDPNLNICFTETDSQTKCNSFLHNTRLFKFYIKLLFFLSRALTSAFYA